MFSKKKESEVKQPSEKGIQENLRNEKINSIAGEIEQLAPGQTLTYKLPEFYWDGFAAFIMTELNPLYPKKGEKYVLFLDKISDGKPAGSKNRYYESNDPKSIAKDILSRNAESRNAERFA